MTKILEVYQKYQNTPVLQEHQLRVAAVAWQICDHFDLPIDKKAIIDACLVHDIGNILKFVADAPAEWFAPQGVDYWMSVKKQMAEQYQTTDEHELSLKIAKELGMSALVLDCIESIDFNKTVEVISRPQFEPRICDYADLRADPNGIVSMDQRLEEGNKRYKNRPDKWLTDDVRAKILDAC